MKRLIISLIAGVLGIAALLAGLAWDAWLHAQDATLAQREGVFDLTNPGHALLGAGMALACGGIFSALHAAWGMAVPRGGGMASPRLRNGALGGAALASVAAVAFALSASAAGHDHTDETALAANEHAHAAEAPVAHAGASDIAEHQAHASAADAAMPAPAMDDPPPASTMQTPDGMAAEDLHADTMTGAPPAAGEMVQVIAGTSAEPALAHAEGAQAHPAPAPIAAGEMPAAAGDTHADPVATAEEQACYKALTEEARVATLRFQDFAVAEAEGYRANPLKPEATHYANPVYSRDGAVLDLARPETLVYWTRDDGAKLLLGVLYKSPKGTSGPTPCGNGTVWHTHTSCVDPATRVQIEDADGACPDGYRLQESGEMMHLWFIGKRSPL